VTEDVENLVLEHLRAIRTELGALKEENRTMQAQTAALRHELRAVTTLVEQCVEDIASIRVRLDRIERRLDLVEVAK
jgi:predicted  nucleic acid-binding Zn-ribbon protein